MSWWVNQMNFHAVLSISPPRGLLAILLLSFHLHIWKIATISMPGIDLFSRSSSILPDHSSITLRYRFYTQDRNTKKMLIVRYICCIKDILSYFLQNEKSTFWWNCFAIDWWNKSLLRRRHDEMNIWVLRTEGWVTFHQIVCLHLLSKTMWCITMQ